MEHSTLSYLRIVMFILLGYVLFQSLSGDQWFLKGYVLLVTIVLISNHFLMFLLKRRDWIFYVILLDGLLSFTLGFLFPYSTLYLILLGVVAVTLTIQESNPKRLRLSLYLFLTIWLLEMIYGAWVIGDALILENLISGSFVGFGILVGSLIRKLYDAQETMDRQYRELNETHLAMKETHEQLRLYSKQVEGMTITRERNRIAREIHDTVGHKMTALLVQLQLGRELINLDVNKAGETLETCEELARGALHELRFSVRTLHEEEGEEQSFIPLIRKVMEEFQRTAQIETELVISGDPTSVSLSIQPTIVRIIQESLTNAKRHGGATRCEVSLHISRERILLVIKDNGMGTDSITAGFGLINMKERVEEHGGTVIFESMGGEGFQITVEFPLLERKWMVGKKG